MPAVNRMYAEDNFEHNSQFDLLHIKVLNLNNLKLNSNSRFNRMYAQDNAASLTFSALY